MATFTLSLQIRLEFDLKRSTLKEELQYGLEKLARSDLYHLLTLVCQNIALSPAW